MKQFFLYIITIGFTFHLSAQDKIPKNEFNVNATGFVANYFSLGSGPSSNNPYIFGYKRLFENSAFRTGFNYNSRSSNTLVNPQQPRSNFSSKNIDIRIGFEFRKPLSNKFMWFYGIDATSNYNLNKSKNVQTFFKGSFNETSVTQLSLNSGTSFGGGPIAGLQWNISKKIVLFTEARAYFNYSENHTNTNWEGVTDLLRNNFQGNFESKDNVDYFKNFDLFLPIDLFVAFKF